MPRNDQYINFASKASFLASVVTLLILSLAFWQVYVWFARINDSVRVVEQRVSVLELGRTTDYLDKLITNARAALQGVVSVVPKAATKSVAGSSITITTVADMGRTIWRGPIGKVRSSWCSRSHYHRDISAENNLSIYRWCDAIHVDGPDTIHDLTFTIRSHNVTTRSN